MATGSTPDARDWSTKIVAAYLTDNKKAFIVYVLRIDAPRCAISGRAA